MTFVRTSDHDWSNLNRASGISVKESTWEPGTWIVVAHYSGRSPVLRDGFPSAKAARAWVADLLEEQS